MIDAELVTRKLALILQDLPALTELAGKPLTEYVGNPMYQALSERYLERMIGRMIDVNFHVITGSGHAPPKDYHDSCIRLGTMNILPVDFARTVAAAAGLRHRIVHEYDEIDPNKLFDAMQVAIKQIPLYLDAVRRALPPNVPFLK